MRTHTVYRRNNNSYDNDFKNISSNKNHNTGWTKNNANFHTPLIMLKIM